MATPRAAVNRDLEQRLRDLEAQVQSLTSAALRREQLSVSQGDFVVSGGGGVVVKGGGDLHLEYADGTAAVEVTDVVDGSGTPYGTGMVVWDDNGVQRDAPLAFMGHRVDGGAEVELFDRTGNRVLAVDGASGYGLAIPHLQFPMWCETSRFTTNSNTFASAYFGTFEVWQPYLDLACFAYPSVDQGVEVRFSIDGVNVSPTESVGVGGAISAFSWHKDMTGYAYGSTHELRLECRATGSGTTPIGCMPYWVRGGQS